MNHTEDFAESYFKVSHWSCWLYDTAVHVVQSVSWISVTWLFQCLPVTNSTDCKIVTFIAAAAMHRVGVEWVVWQGLLLQQR